MAIRAQRSARFGYAVMRRGRPQNRRFDFADGDCTIGWQPAAGRVDRHGETSGARPMRARDSGASRLRCFHLDHVNR